MSFKRTIIAACIMILTLLSLRYISHSETIHPNKPLNTFPTKIGDWSGTEERFDAEVYEILGVDDSVLINYQGPKRRTVQLYVGFYQSQKEGDLIHSPKNCMPGGGWNIVQSSLEELTIPDSNPGRIKVIRLVLEKQVQRQIALYWFQSRGRFTYDYPGSQSN